MAWWNMLFGGAGGLVKAGTDAARIVVGDRAAREAQLSAEQLAAMAQYAAEFAARPQRTWIDSVADALNRMVRPSLAFGVLGTFVWAAVDPVTFAETMQVLAIVPEPLWVMGRCLGLLFLLTMMTTSSPARSTTARTSSARWRRRSGARRAASPTPASSPSAG